MEGKNNSFTALEHRVLNAVCEMHPTDRTLLQAQLATAEIDNRENTGGGFYTRFSVKRDAGIRLPLHPRLRDGPGARIDGLAHGMGFVLWLEDGFASCLEGYSYAEHTVDLDFATVGFELSTIRPGAGATRS